MFKTFLDILDIFRHFRYFRHFVCFSPETDRSGHAEQDVHSDGLPVPDGEEGAGHDMEQVLLPLPARGQAFPDDSLQSGQHLNRVFLFAISSSLSVLSTKIEFWHIFLFSLLV
jgi:hypothetical protein